MAEAIEKYLPIWEEVTRLVTANPEVAPTIAGQLRLATVQGGGEGLLYLAVAQEFTQKLLETNLRSHILQALRQLPAAADIHDFIVLVDNLTLAVTSGSGYNSVTVPTAETKTNTRANPGSESQSTKSGTTYDGGFTAAQNPAQQQDSAQNAPVAVSESNLSAAGHPVVGAGIATINPATMLNPKLTFDNFVIGQTNRMAQAASIAVAEAPGVAYRPLFIYGDSGLGKTHLLHAIGNAALELHPGIRVRYVSSEEFTNSFINAIKNNKGAEFHESWRQVDILLIDDIQFLSRAKETLEAFFHTFNTLQNQNKQIVITSDVAPKQLADVENRLISRFEQGLLTDIQAPERDTRIAILKMKAEREHLVLSNDVLEFIADNFTANIRSLEGALTKVIAYASLTQQEINYDLVYTLLQSQLPSEADIEIQPQKIISITAEFFNVTVDEIYGPKRTQQLTKPRHIAMYLCHELTSLSLPKIGDLFNGRDHTTVMHACKKIASAISSDRNIYNEVEELTEKIRNENRK